MISFMVVGAVGLAILLVSLVFDGILESLDFGPDWLSGVAVGAFAGAFGAAGVVVSAAGAQFVVAAAVGLAAGFLVGALAHITTRALNKDSKGAAYSPEDLLGVQAVTLMASPAPGALVQVRVSVAGHPVTLNARCGEALEAGQSVRITEVISATQVSVSPVISE